LGKDKEAIACQSESVEIGRRLGDKEVLAFSLSCLGDTYFMLGRFGQSKQGNDDERQEQNLQEAIKAYEQTIELFKEIGETNALAQPYTNLGSIYSMLENYPKAAEYLEKSVAIKLKQGDRYGLIASSFNLCNVYEHLGDYVQARKHIDAIITMHTDGFINVQQIFPKALAARGRLNFAMKQVEPAIGDYVLACFSSLEFGLETLLEMIEEVEKRVDKLVESGKTSQATTLCSVLIEIWRDKGFVEIAPQLVQRLEKKISLTS
jgi:tetratricopeptide (TPR) repeat protein